MIIIGRLQIVIYPGNQCYAISVNNRMLDSFSCAFILTTVTINLFPLAISRVLLESLFVYLNVE